MNRMDVQDSGMGMPTRIDPVQNEMGGGDNPLMGLHQRRRQNLNMYIERDPQIKMIMQAINMGVDPKQAFMKWGDPQNVAAFNQSDYSMEQARMAALSQGYSAGPPSGTQQMIRGGRVRASRLNWRALTE